MIPDGRLLQVNVSRGGVPKRPVEAARITRMGVEGDRQHADTVHGGPHRAVSLLGIEAIRRVAAEGHPIAPGSTGENLTIEGFDVSTLPPGTRLAIGDEVELELASSAGPCETIRESFRDGRFGRLSPDRHPADSRMYARVLAEGVVRAGDPIVVSPPASDAAELHLLAVQLDQADASWSRALWRAARDAGETVHVIADGELSVSAAPDLPHPSFNIAHGLVTLPHLAGVVARHLDEHRVSGLLLADAAPLPDLRVAYELGRYAAAPADVASGDAEPAADVRELARDEVGEWAEIVTTVNEMAEPVARAWRSAERGLADTAHHHRFVAYVAGSPAGAASLHTHHGVGWLCAASVLPEMRGRGVQRALIAARAARAASLRCEVIGASVVEGGASEENLRRLGFRRVATRRAYRYDGTGLLSPPA